MSTVTPLPGGRAISEASEGRKESGVSRTAQACRPAVFPSGSPGRMPSSTALFLAPWSGKGDAVKSQRPSNGKEPGHCGLGTDMCLLFGLLILLKIKNTVPRPRCLERYVFRYPICVVLNSNQRNCHTTSQCQSPQREPSVCGETRSSAKGCCLLPWALHTSYIHIHIPTYTCIQ